MKLKNLVLALALLMAITGTASAGANIYTFTLNGAGADPANNTTGTAYGTFTLSDPNILTLNITYTGLSSDFQKVDGIFWLSPVGTLYVEFQTAADLPPSGQWTDTIQVSASTDAEIIQAISSGKSQFQLGTANYPFADFGEIGGLINPTPVPEPPGFGLAAAAGAAGLVVRRLRSNLWIDRWLGGGFEI